MIENIGSMEKTSPKVTQTVRHKRGDSGATTTTAVDSPRIDIEMPETSAEKPIETCLQGEQPLWEKHCVLSLDGGGIRGYSSLVILRHIMQAVEKLETADLTPEELSIHSSYHPEDYTPCINNLTSPLQSRTTFQSDTNIGSKSHCGTDGCRYRPCHYFDYIGGTSTGGLSSIMLGRLRMSVEDSLAEYHTLGKEVFGRPRIASVRGPIPWLRDKYDGKTIQKAVDDVVQRRMSSAERSIGAGNFNSPPGACRTVVFAYASRINTSLIDYVDNTPQDTTNTVETDRPYLIRSYDHWTSTQPTINERNPGVAHSITIWEAARATTAAPTYFEPIVISNRMFGDGGFGTNNPAAEMFWEVVYMNGGDTFKHRIALLLSIGTGQCEISRFSEGTYSRFRKYAHAAKKLASDSSKVHEMMTPCSQAWKVPYYRFDVPERYQLCKIKLDEFKEDKGIAGKRESTLKKIERITEEYLKEPEVQVKIQEVAQILFEQRKKRSGTDIWGLVANGRQWRCTIKGCKRCQELRARRKDLKHHLEREHDIAAKDLETHIRNGAIPL